MAAVGLVTKDRRILEDARQLLIEAAEQGFEGVVIIGRRPEGTVAVWHSRGLSILQTLGAIELAKHDLISRS